MPFKAELKALRVAAEIVGVVTMLITVVRVFVTGSLMDAIRPLLPVVGGLALAVCVIAGVSIVVLLRGAERLGGVAFVVVPVVYVVLGFSVARLGLFVLAWCVVGLVLTFVDVVGRKGRTGP
jgi:hypothetical protein